MVTLINELEDRGVRAPRAESRRPARHRGAPRAPRRRAPRPGESRARVRDRGDLRQARRRRPRRPSTASCCRWCRRSTPDRSPDPCPAPLRILLPALLIIGWLAAGAVGGPYFGRISEVSSTDQASFLPASAEATEVSELIPEFSGSDDIPAIVRADPRRRPAGRRPRLGGGRARRRAGGDRRRRRSRVPAIESDDGEALEVFVPISGDVDETVAELRTRAHRRGARRAGGLDHRPGRIHRRPGRRVRRHRRPAAARRAGRRVRHPADRLPLAAAADPGARHRRVLAVPRAPRRLVARQGRGGADQRAGAGHPVHPRDRRGDRLRAAVRLAVPRGAARLRSGAGTPPGRPCGGRSSRSSPRAARSSSGCSACCSATSTRTRRSARSPRSASPARCSAR